MSADDFPLDELHLLRQRRDEPEPVRASELFSQTPQLAGQEAPIDWDAVDSIRSKVSKILSELVSGTQGAELNDPAVQEQGRSLILDAIREEQRERPNEGKSAWTLAEQEALATAAFDMIFRLGRLQPLVDNDTVENVIIMGHDRVTLQHTDGSLSSAPPVARSDAALIEQIQMLAERTDGSAGQAKSFSPANPTLRMTLPSGERLTAKAWVTPVPTVVIRRHRLIEVTLEDLVEREMMSPLAASFLTAAVRAKLSIVVAGPQSAGKTTLMRAICAVIPPNETIATFETQYELFLHKMHEAHPIVHAFEASPGGEVGAGGGRVGEFTLTQALESSMADFIQRMIVGEVVGREIWALVKAAESGAGAMCTTHGRTAQASMEKLVTCMMEYGPSISAELAARKLTECIDIVIHLGVELIDDGQGRTRQRRYISEIIAVEFSPETAGQIAVTPIFGHSGAREATPNIFPDHLSHLEQHGFDITAFLLEGRLQGLGETEEA